MRPMPAESLMVVVNYLVGKNRNRPRRLMRFMTRCWRSSVRIRPKVSRPTKLRIDWLRIDYREPKKSRSTDYTDYTDYEKRDGHKKAQAAQKGIRPTALS